MLPTNIPLMKKLLVQTSIFESEFKDKIVSYMFSQRKA